MRVTAPPATVPRETVQNSRIVFSSPISSRTGSPWYLRSCGSKPMAVCGKMRLPLPMRVGPWIWAPAPTSVPSPISTPGPITAKGPTRTPSPRMAPGSTWAKGWMWLVMARVSRSQVHPGGGQHRLGRQVAVHQRLAGQPAVAAADAHDVDLEADLVSRHHRAPELGVGDAGQVEELAAPLLDQLQQHQGTGLRHRLDQQHPGHHRLAGEVAGEERLVDGDVLDRHQPLARLVLEDAVDQQHRVAMRQHQIGRSE